MTCRKKWLLATKSNMKTVNIARPDSLKCILSIHIVIHEYETKLTASETKLTASETKLTASETKLTASKEEQQELLRVLEQTKRMAYARDQQISMLESDGQLMLEKCEY